MRLFKIECMSFIFSIPIIIVFGLSIVGCRQAESPARDVDVEVAAFVDVRLRSPGPAADLSKAKIVGNPTELEMTEVAKVIGRVPGPWRSQVNFVRFVRTYDDVRVDFAIGHDYFSMKRITNKWVIFAKGNIN